MTADDHLSPSQFGFHEAKMRDWGRALDKYDVEKPDGGGVTGRIDPNTELHTGQGRIYQSRVDHFVEQKSMRSHTPVEIYHEGGKMWLGEGHHRMAAARIKGQKSIGVVHYGRE